MSNLIANRLTEETLRKAAKEMDDKTRTQEQIAADYGVSATALAVHARPYRVTRHRSVAPKSLADEFSKEQRQALAAEMDDPSREKTHSQIAESIGLNRSQLRRITDRYRRWNTKKQAKLETLPMETEREEIMTEQPTIQERRIYPAVFVSAAAELGYDIGEFLEPAARAPSVWVNQPIPHHIDQTQKAIDRMRTELRKVAEADLTDRTGKVDPYTDLVPNDTVYLKLKKAIKAAEKALSNISEDQRRRNEVQERREAKKLKEAQAKLKTKEMEYRRIAKMPAGENATPTQLHAGWREVITAIDRNTRAIDRTTRAIDRTTRAVNQLIAEWHAEPGS